MKFRYSLPTRLRPAALALDEFANGAAQCHVRLKDMSVWPGVLIGGAIAIVAMRGQTELPFEVEQIETLFQTKGDRHPKERDGWNFFDTWRDNSAA